MENAGNQKSGNRDGGNSDTATDIGGNAIGDGGRVRTDEASVSSQSIGIGGSENAKSINGISVDRSIGGNQSVAITDGYYFTPNGRIARIPDGHYIGSDGRLRKRRKQGRDSSNANGNTYRDRPEASEHEKEFTTENDFRIDKPLNIRGGRRKAKTVKSETSKLTMITLLSSGAAAIFTSVALLTKHDHWSLQTDEAKILAEALNDAISTLPEKYYAQVIAIIEKWIPWINLCFVVGAIIVPRLEASAKRIEKSHSQQSETSNSGNARAKDNPFSNWTSLGYNQ
jgi:hypothetical protein